MGPEPDEARRKRQLKAIHALLDQREVDEPLFREWLKKTHGSDTCADLGVEKLSNVIEMLELKPIKGAR